MTLAPGVRLGPYQILAKLGEGGMGEVYRARDTRLGREVGIKILPEHFSRDLERLARFEREARSASGLSSPHIVVVHDIGDQNGIRYIATELIDGSDLRTILRRGAPPLRRALDLAAQVADGLAVAHEKGVVHRDLKPENILVSSQGVAKIADFGLAKLVDTEGATGDEAPTLDAVRTGTGILLGTVSYMSPEQVRGESVDFRSDQFALGAILYELTTGRRPFAGATSAETMTAILREDPEPLTSAAPSLPAPVRWLIERLLSKEPGNRYNATADIAHDLADLRDRLSELGSVALPQGPAKTLSRRFAPLVIALVALLSAGTGWWMRGAPAKAAAHGPVELKFQHLTEEPGVESSPSLSPDGKNVAFVSSSRGNDDIYLLRVGGRNPDDLTASSPAADDAPAFSPDGESIAFRSERSGGGIFLMGATGESVRRLTDFGFDPAWSPDGKEIVVDSEPVHDPMSRATPSSLWVVPVKGGARRLVLKSDGVGPSWSPNGKRIAFWGLRWPSPQRDIWTVAADGSQAKAPVPVTNDPALDWSPEWSPDGRFLYFASNRGGTMNLWRVRIDESTGRTLAPPEPVTAPASWIGGLSFSHDGHELAMADLSQGSDVWRIAFDTGKEQLVGNPTRVLHAQGILSVDCTPSGEAVVFSRRGVPWESLVTLKSDGTGYTQLTDYSQEHRFPRWSPDAKRIVFSSTASGSQQIWIVRPDGSGLSRLTESDGAFNPAWSPDGRRIAFGDQADEIVIIDADRPAAAPIRIPDPGHPGQTQPISWSPDGSLLAADWQRPDRSTGVLIYSFATKKFRLVTREGRWPQWLPDGKRLLYQREGGLAVLNLASGRKQWVLPDGTLRKNSSWQNFCLSRDGRELIYLESFGEGDIWMMTLGERSAAPK